MSSAARKGRTARILVPLVLLIAWLGVGGTLGPYAGKLGEVATNDQAAFLPQSAESTRVSEEQKAFSADEALPALVVWTAKDGGRLPADAREAATRILASLADAGFTAGRPSPALASYSRRDPRTPRRSPEKNFRFRRQEMVLCSVGAPCCGHKLHWLSNLENKYAASVSASVLTKSCGSR
ncbi:hypothetical protein ACFTZG_32190, partial [Streptomyces albidoflavus]